MPPRWRTAVAALCVAATGAVITGAGAVSAAPTPEYLALGDSVPFGFSPLVSPLNPNNYVGYPTPVGAALGAPTTNAACPGETSGSYLSTTAVDNGCRAFRSLFPLHTAYTGTQAEFASNFLRTHPGTGVVTVMLGANDLLRLLHQCFPSGGASDPGPLQAVCIVGGLPQVLTTAAHNLHAVFSQIRAAGFHGTLVAVTYYSPNYGNPVETAAVAALDAAISFEAGRAGGRVADGFGAFQRASQASDGDACAAGLLIALPVGGCDNHPSVKGRDLLAQTVLSAIHYGDVATAG